MTYLMINGVEFSDIVNELNITKSANYTSQTNAAGNTVVDLINHKRQIEVGFIPLDDAKAIELTAELDKFEVKLSFMDPRTGAVEINVKCIMPSDEISYYTIRQGKTLLKAFKVKFQEL